MNYEVVESIGILSRWFGMWKPASPAQCLEMFCPQI